MKVVWVTMLALANKNGQVMVSVPGLAVAAGVTMDQCIEAVGRLSSPDPWSRTKAHEGRRIAEIEGGFVLLNYVKYREQRDADERRIQVREAVAKHREAKAKAAVIHGNPRKSQAEAEAEAEADKRKDPDSSAPPAAPEPTIPVSFETVGDADSWNVTVALNDALRAAFPSLDVSAEYAKAQGWVVANRAKRKTPRGMPKFLFGWMERAQNRGSGGPGGGGALRQSPAAESWAVREEREKRRRAADRRFKAAMGEG